MSECGFVQYLENGWTEFNQILYFHYHLQDLCWNCYAPSVFQTVLCHCISLSNDSAMAGLKSDPLTILVYFVNFGVEEWSFVVEWSQILCSLIKFIKTNFTLLL